MMYKYDGGNSYQQSAKKKSRQHLFHVRENMLSVFVGCCGLLSFVRSLVS